MKEETQRKLSELSKALAHPYRLQIIEILANLPGEKQCMVGNIVDKLPISQSTVSQHLKVLKESGWIKGRVEGPRVCYCLKEGVFDFYLKQIKSLKSPSTKEH